jgi:hypothetical protein
MASKSGGITHELVEDIIQQPVEDMVLQPAEDMDKQPAKDFAAQVPVSSSKFGRKCACEVVRNSASIRSAHSVASAHAPLRQKDIMAGKSGELSGGISREHVEDIVQKPVKDMVLEFAKDFAAQVPAHSSKFGYKCACEVVRNSVSVRPAHSAVRAPTRQKDIMAGKSGGITREHVEDMVQQHAKDMDKQPAIDFAAQVPAHSSEFGRKCACKVVRNSVGVRLAHSAEHAPTRQKSVASKSGEWARASRKPCLSASRGLLVATALMMRLCHMDAAFTPRNRAELQGDGQSTAGVFGCVGSCGQSFLSGSGEYTHCSSSANGPWESGSGSPCNNADVLVPVGQGSGTYGALGDWDVSSVQDMSGSKCSPSAVRLFAFFVLTPAFFFSPDSVSAGGKF